MLVEEYEVSVHGEIGGVVEGGPGLVAKGRIVNPATSPSGAAPRRDAKRLRINAKHGKKHGHFAGMKRNCVPTPGTRPNANMRNADTSNELRGNRLERRWE